jgi:hypothetical protein
MNTGEFFSANYFDARERFVAACNENGFAHQALPIDAPSPRADPLTIDVGVAGATMPASALIVSSGIHGVEGFFGSAVQLACLKSLGHEWRLPEATAVVFIHAINPFGFAWLRRFNEDNVDLNRNFLLPGEAYQGAPPLIDQFRKALTPRGVHRRFGFWSVRMGLLAMRYGMGAFWRTLPVGQYEHPEFLYFGGRQPAQSAVLLNESLPALVGSAGQIVHLDFHTGLGRWANGELLLGAQTRAEDVAWWRDHFPETTVKQPETTSRSYSVRGGFGEWMASRFADRQCHSAVAEFGTYSPRRVMQALSEELRWHWRLSGQSTEHWSRRQLADVFVPRHAGWRARTLEAGRSLVARAIDVLSKSRQSE